MRRPEEVVFRLTWDGLAALCRQLAAQVAADYSPDVVVGVLRGGTLPGALIALLLRRDFHSLRVPVTSSPAAHVPPRSAVDGRRVLLVDERMVDGVVLAWGPGSSDSWEPGRSARWSWSAGKKGGQTTPGSR